MILGIYGAGDGGREFLELVNDINRLKQRWESIVFIDDFSPVKELSGYPIFRFEEIKKIYSPKEIEFILAVGQPKDRKSIYNNIKSDGYNLTSLIHPSVKLMEGAVFGEGCVMWMYVIVGCDVVIGNNVFILHKSTIGSHSHIGDHVSVSSHVAIGGDVIIDDEAYLGMNVCVREACRVGRKSIISAGSAVLKDIDDGVVAQGNPARAFLKNISGDIYKRR